MAFAPLQPRKPHARRNSNEITVRATKLAKKTLTAVSIPRSVLREAGLSDIPGDKIDVLIGTGSDAGAIAIIAGSRYSLVKSGNHRVQFTSSLLLSEAPRATTCTYEVGRKQLIIELPLGAALREPEVAIEHEPVQRRYGRTIGAVAAE